MAKYLLVAHQTAESEELLEAAKNLARDDPEAEFALLVPATPVGKLLVWEEGETVDVARRRAASARARLESHGLRVEAARTGDQDPTAAIADEMHAGRQYDVIVISTLPAGVSKWLGMDVLSRVRRNFPRHRVIHVVAAAATGAEAPS
ncbi:MAG TPA: hypothetical protein VKF14_03980 [Candidatus Dormibacteraeota bacterium]|nr:hypothetical protein [Candidatus Dormibacteraeota bacterium]